MKLLLDSGSATREGAMLEEARGKKGTSRRSSRSVRQRSEVQFRILLEKFPAGAYTCDPDGLITYFNQHAVRVWGRAPKLNDPVDRFCGSFKLFATDGSPIAHDKCWMALALQTGKEYNGHEIVIERPDGRRVTTLAHANPIRDESGKLLGAVNILVDISDRKCAEEELRAADRHKNEFLAMLSHELRNPLAPMLTAIELLSAGAENPESSRRAQEILSRQIRRLVRLVDELLDVSRITRGKITLKKETIEVQTAVRRSLEPLRSMFDTRRLEVSVSVPLHPLHVEGDWVRFEQILGNLLNNAAKYTDPGGKIRVIVEQEGKSVALSVRDTGIGISKEMLPHVFELFEQGPRALDRAEGGLGIGLTLVRNLTALHGGSIEAHSDGEGTGSEFVVRLPLVEVPFPARPAEAPIRDTFLAGEEGALRIVIVDDNPDLVTSMRELLESWNCTVSVAYEGHEAIDVVLAALPDIVLLDIGLPVMNGYQVAAALRQAGYRGLLVAVTGYGFDQDRKRAIEAGFDRHLVKPVHGEALRRLLGEIQSLTLAPSPN